MRIQLVGFATGDLSEVALSTAATVVPVTDRPSGKYALELNRNGSVANAEIRGLAATGKSGYYAVSTAYYRFWLNAVQLPPSESGIANFQDTASGYKAALHINSAGALLFYDGLGTLQAIGSTLLQQGTWYCIEVKVGTGIAASWAVRINGNAEIGGTANQGSTQNGSIKFGGNATYTDRLRIADLSIDDSNFPGLSQLTCLNAYGAGTDTGWKSGTATSDYTQVSETVPNGDTSYAASSTAGDAFTVHVASTASLGITGTINAVKACCVVRDAGSTAMHVRVRSGGGDQLIQQSAFTYQGSFQVPQGAFGSASTFGFQYGGAHIAFSPTGDGGKGSLFMTGHTYDQAVAEISIPTPAVNANPNNLPVARVLQNFLGILPGANNPGSPFPNNDTTVNIIGGLQVVGSKLVGTAFIYYPGGSTAVSHWSLSSLTLATATKQGFFSVGPTPNSPADVAGYMCPVPSEWQGALGFTYLTGQGQLQVVSRGSYGPGMYGFNPADLSTSSTAPTKPFLYYRDQDVPRPPNVQLLDTVAFSGTVTSGSFTLTFNGQTTAAIAWNAGSAAVQSALQALSNIGAGNVSCTGGPLPTRISIIFGAALGGSIQNLITVNSGALVGGLYGVSVIDYPFTPNQIFGIAPYWTGAAFIPNTRSILIFGQNANFNDPLCISCYGDNGVPLTGFNSAGQTIIVVSNDQQSSAKGGHYVNQNTGLADYINQVWNYDVNDFVAVKNGQLQPTALLPKQNWTWNFPYQSTGTSDIGGVDFDPVNNLLYVVEIGATSWNGPVVHVYRVALAAATLKETTDTDPGGSYALLAEVLNTDPATGALWTLAGVDGVEVGMVNSINQQARLTYAAVMVDYTPPVQLPGHPTVTGQVTLTDGPGFNLPPSLVGPQTLINGMFTYVVPGLGIGSYALSCTFPAQGQFGQSSKTATLIVSGITNQTTTTITPVTVACGTAPAIPVKVTSSAGTPVGTVTLTLAGTTYGPQTLDGTGSTTFTNISNALAPGTYTATATYTPQSGSNFQTSTGSATITITGTATSVVIPQPTSVPFGSPASVAVQVQASSGTASGTVALTIDPGPSQIILPAQPLDPTGKTTFTISGLTAGVHTMSASFTPTAGSCFSLATAGPPNTPTLTIGVTTQTTISQPLTYPFGAPAGVTVTVTPTTGSAVPSGFVTLSVDGGPPIP